MPDTYLCCIGTYRFRRGVRLGSNARRRTTPTITSADEGDDPARSDCRVNVHDLPERALTREEALRRTLPDDRYRAATRRDRPR